MEGAETRVASQVNWGRFLQAVFRETKIGESEPVVVYNLPWLRSLTALIANYTASVQGRQILDDYLKWQAIFYTVGFLHIPHFRFRFVSVLGDRGMGVRGGGGVQSVSGGAGAVCEGVGGADE